MGGGAGCRRRATSSSARYLRSPSRRTASWRCARQPAACFVATRTVGGAARPRSDPGAGAARRVTFDLPRGGAVPTDVAVGSDGSVWFLQFRANRNGRFKDGQFLDVEAGRENAGLSGIAVAPHDDVWFGMLRRASLGRLRNGHITVFALPRDNARPFSVAVDRDGNVWYADISGFVGMLPA